MPVFDYQATDANGVSINAEISADDAVAAVDALRAQGLTVSEIVQHRQTTVEDVSSFFSDALNPGVAGRGSTEIGRPPDRPIVCGWCESRFPPSLTESNCPNCGGTLPLPPGPDRGPAPPSAPRHIPRQFEFKVKFTTVFWVGLVFLVVGLLMAVVTLGFSLLFAVVGGFLVRSSWNTGARRIAALKYGDTAEGEITFVGYDESLTVNGKHPYLVRYRWDVGGRYREGRKQSWDDAALDHFRGEPVWVVYMPDDTRKSAVWPPLA